MGGLTVGATSRWKAPPGWRKLREAIFRRDGHVCYRCGRWAGTIDHIVPLALGGTSHPSNLRPACQKCQSSTGATLKNRLYPGTPRRRGQPPRPARRW